MGNARTLTNCLLFTDLKSWEALLAPQGQYESLSRDVANTAQLVHYHWENGFATRFALKYRGSPVTS